MPTWQRKLHNDLRWKLVTELPSGELYITPNILAGTIRLRQMMVCPKVLDPNLPWGAGLEGILDDVRTSELTHWVISTPFRDPIPWIEKFFQEAGYKTERLMGGDGIDADELDRRIKRWTQNGGPMIQTIKYAESYELPAARIMYMLGYEYDPEANSQAEDRIHRDIRVTPQAVDIYYTKHRGSYDEDLIAHMATSADNNYNLLNRPLSEVFRLFGD
jgi:hypothetical protein